jgi:hypothetical protein
MIDARRVAGICSKAAEALPLFEIKGGWLDWCLLKLPGVTM